MFNRSITKPIRPLVMLCILHGMFGSFTLYANFATLAKNDPFPLFESIDPHTYLLTKQKLYYTDPEWAELRKDHFTFSISPFAQTANRGKTISGDPLTTPGSGGGTAELGDLTGKTNLIALTYGTAPTGQTLAPLLQTARTGVFGAIQPPVINPTTGTIDDGRFIDPNEQFGVLSFPLAYRKRGLRFNFEGLLGAGFGASLQTSVCSISQTPRRPIVGTTTGNFPPNCTPQIDACAVQNLLIDEFDNILDQLDLELEKCSRTSIEEVRFNLYWRWILEFNREEIEWPHFLMIPFAHAMASISPGAAIDPDHLFEPPFGNNKHTAAAFKAGINFDFIDTIEIGGEVGMTHFFAHDFDNFRLPNSEFQNNIFPFKANVTIRPGTSWHFGGKIAAYHFLDKLSMYFQYIMLEHKEDHVKLRQCPVDENSPFDLESYEESTCFKVKLANIGFNYDISPNCSLGFLWQAPLSQRNAYASTTLLFTFNATI